MEPADSRKKIPMKGPANETELASGAVLRDSPIPHFFYLLQHGVIDRPTASLRPTPVAGPLFRFGMMKELNLRWEADLEPLETGIDQASSPCTASEDLNPSSLPATNHGAAGYNKSADNHVEGFAINKHTKHPARAYFSRRIGYAMVLGNKYGFLTMVLVTGFSVAAFAQDKPTEKHPVPDAAELDAVKSQADQIVQKKLSGTDKDIKGVSRQDLKKVAISLIRDKADKAQEIPLR
jgi:hypothetical protein